MNFVNVSEQQTMIRTTATEFADHYLSPKGLCNSCFYKLIPY